RRLVSNASAYSSGGRKPTRTTSGSRWYCGSPGTRLTRMPTATRAIGGGTDTRRASADTAVAPTIRARTSATPGASDGTAAPPPARLGGRAQLGDAAGRRETAGGDQGTAERGDRLGQPQREVQEDGDTEDPVHTPGQQRHLVVPYRQRVLQS